MTKQPDDEFWDDLFHGCAWAAYVELAAACRGQPDTEETRRLTYRYYEEELAERNRRRRLAACTSELTESRKRAKVEG